MATSHRTATLTALILLFTTRPPSMAILDKETIAIVVGTGIVTYAALECSRHYWNPPDSVRTDWGGKYTTFRSDLKLDWFSDRKDDKRYDLTFLKFEVCTGTNVYYPTVKRDADTTFYETFTVSEIAASRLKKTIELVDQYVIRPPSKEPTQELQDFIQLAGKRIDFHERFTQCTNNPTDREQGPLFDQAIFATQQEAEALCLGIPENVRYGESSIISKHRSLDGFLSDYLQRARDLHQEWIFIQKVIQTYQDNRTITDRVIWAGGLLSLCTLKAGLFPGLR